jgi:hypothetical protein
MPKRRRNSDDYSSKQTKQPIQAESIPAAEDNSLDLLALLGLLKDVFEGGNTPVEMPLNEVRNEQELSEPEPSNKEENPQELHEQAENSKNLLVESSQPEIHENPNNTDNISSLEDKKETGEQMRQYIACFSDSKLGVYGLIPSYEAIVEDTDLTLNPEPSVCSEPELITTNRAQLFIDSLTTLPQKAVKAQPSGVSVFIDKCQLDAVMQKLHIMGVIQQIIEYTSASSINEPFVDSDLNKLVSNVPFEVSIKVNFLAPLSTESEILLDLSPFGLNSTDNGNTLMYRIDTAELLDIDFKVDDEAATDILENSVIFNSIRRTIVLTLSIRLYQRQL